MLSETRIKKTGLTMAIGIASLALATHAVAQPDCFLEELKNDSAKDGDNGWVCPCFIPDEIVMAVLSVPEDADANELLNVQILWDSFLGGPSVTIERQLIIYDLNQEGPVDPNSLTVIQAFDDPELHRGFLNVFDLTDWGIILPERRFAVGLKFANDKTQNGGLDQPSIVEDFDGHNNWDNTVRNWVYAIPGGWKQAQQLGTSGDWIMRAEVNSCYFDGIFRMNDPEPGIAGTVNTFSVTGGEPGKMVHFAYSIREGLTNVPGCSGLQVELKNPKIMGSLIADANGDVDLNMNVPAGAQGLTVHFQAAHAAPICEKTNKVTFTFQ